MKLKYRLQTHDECVTLAVATAIEAHLASLGPEYMIQVDTKALEAAGGIHVVSKALEVARDIYPWLRYEGATFNDPHLPMVGATWMNGYAHAIAKVGDKKFYDSGLGKVVSFTPEQLEKTASWFKVYSEDPPVTNKFLKNGIIKFFARLFGFV